jgi:hypothetical protein
MTKMSGFGARQPWTIKSNSNGYDKRNEWWREREGRIRQKFTTFIGWRDHKSHAR